MTPERKKCPNCGAMVVTTIQTIQNGRVVRTWCHHCADSGQNSADPTPAVQHERAKVVDSTLEWMKANNVPMTRENYLAIEYMGTPPEDTGGEIEASIPWEIKHSEDIALMAQMGVRWEPNDECED